MHNLLIIKEKKKKVFSVSCGAKSPLSASSTFFGAKALEAQAVTKKKIVQKTKTLRNLLELKDLRAERQDRQVATSC